MILESLLFTMFCYMLYPVAYRMQYGRIDKEKASKLALKNSLIWAGIFLIALMEFAPMYRVNFAPAVLYYFVNKFVLSYDKDKKKNNQTTQSTKSTTSTQSAKTNTDIGVKQKEWLTHNLLSNQTIRNINEINYQAQMEMEKEIENDKKTIELDKEFEDDKDIDVEIDQNDDDIKIDNDDNQCVDIDIDDDEDDYDDEDEEIDDEDIDIEQEIENQEKNQNLQNINFDQMYNEYLIFQKKLTKIAMNPECREKFTRSDICRYIMSLEDAYKKDNKNYKYVIKIYDYFDNDKQEQLLNGKEFEQIVSNMIMRFDMVANVECFIQETLAQSFLFGHCASEEMRQQAHKLIRENKQFKEEWYGLEIEYMKLFYMNILKNK